LASGFFRDPYEIITTVESGYSFGVAYCADNEYISGLNPSLVYSTQEVPSEVDLAFLSTFQKSGIKTLSCSNSLFYTVSLESGSNVNFNERIFFDLVNGYFKTYSSYNFGDTLFFYDGQLMNKVSDYTYSSKLLIKSGSSLTSTGVLDVIPHSYTIDSINSGDYLSGSVISPASQNSLLFINGDVIISGVDYELTLSGFVLKTSDYSATSGTLSKIVFSGVNIKTDFTSGNFIETNFYDNSIMGFVNRKRLPISEFKQLSSVELGYGESLTPCFSVESIYTNEGNFINE
jgi:hypothetical protein